MGKDKRHKHDGHHDNDDQLANSLRAEERNQERGTTGRMNRLWLWLGVLILVAILLWWIFTIGFAEDVTGYTNFGN